MPEVRWREETFVPVAPDAAFAWLTDFRADDHDRPAYRRAVGASAGRPARREVVAREGNVVRLRDAWGRRTIDATVTLDPDARAYRIEGPHGYAARWWVTPNPGGARLHVEGVMAPRGILGLLVPLFAKGMKREMALDFRGHVADMLHELNPDGVPVGDG